MFAGYIKFLIIFDIWIVYTGMLREYGEFFAEFFDLEIGIYQNFTLAS